MSSQYHLPPVPKAHSDPPPRYTSDAMTSLWPILIGVLLGFGFGVGCALAVLYSIFMGGYRAALRDAQQPHPPRRYQEALRRIAP